MKRTNPIIFLTIAILCFTGCADYRLYHNNNIQAPQTHVESIDAIKLNRIFLIGDAGKVSHGTRKNMALLTRLAAEEQTPKKTVFLGDNIYPIGLTNKDSILEAEARVNLDFQATPFLNSDMEVIFIPGNHDWEQGKPNGLKNIQRQGKHIRSYESPNIKLLPSNGCPGPEVIVLNEEYVMIIIDSQWWLQDWDRTLGMHDKCEIRTRPDFVAEFREAVRQHDEKQIIVALHHPLYTNGSHGGYFTFKDHILPLNQSHEKPGFPIPLPFIASIYPMMRGTFGNIQDIAHPKYQDLKRALLNEVGHLENVIFASGHEHSLQYQRHRGHHFIVSGSGAKRQPVKNNKDLIFGHGEYGFFTLDLYVGGKMLLQAWEPTDDQGNGKVVFSTMIEREIPETTVELTEENLEVLSKDSTESIISDDYDRKGFYQFLFGKHYRTLYQLPIKAKVINLNQELGGMEVLKRGGGMQTASLRLEAPSGQQYVLRGLKKDASGLLPDMFQGTFALDLLQDQLTASHPFGALAIPTLADAAEIYHTNPQIRYLPAQKRLGKYSGKFSDALYLYEERPSGDGSQIVGFGRSQKIISTFDVIDEMQSDHGHVIDQAFGVRTRMFDMFIGDWDRHDDQWRWASFEDGDITTYRPIPRDRDQAFADYDGFLSGLAYAYLPTMRKFGPFKSDLSRLKWFNYNGRYFDRYFLNGSTKDLWIESAKLLQESMTDDVIDEAMKSWPNDIRENTRLDVGSILKERRKHLVEWAENYYAFVAKEVDVRGTDEKDLFEITRNADGSTLVEVFEWQRKEKSTRQFTRLFQPDETKIIYLYGLDDDDRFEFRGEGTGGIKIRIIGGDGHDFYVDLDREELGQRKQIKIWDEHRPDHPRNQLSSGTKYQEIGENEIEFERKRFQYDYGLPLFVFEFNPDEGLVVGGGYQWRNYGFNKSPYASDQSFTLNYGTANEAFNATYSGEFNHLLGSWDLTLDGLFEGPNYVQNYYGDGNETPEFFEDDRFYHRILRNRYGIYPTLRKRFARDDAEFGFNFSAERVKIERSEDRFINDPNLNLDPEVFEGSSFAGVSAHLQYQIQDNPVLTRRGIKLRLEGGVRQALDRSDLQRYFKSEFSLHAQLKSLGRPVIATRIGYETNGGEYDFFNAATLGGKFKFRGIPNNRFTGERVFYQNIDIRYRLFAYQSYLLPAAMGITLNFDHGRVWQPDEDSKVWHYSYGGGVWISPFNTLLINLSYNVSDIDKRFTGTLGFFF